MAKEIVKLFGGNIRDIQNYSKNGWLYKNTYRLVGYDINTTVYIPYQLRKAWAQTQAAAAKIKAGRAHRLRNKSGDLYTECYDGQAIEWRQYL